MPLIDVKALSFHSYQILPHIITAITISISRLLIASARIVRYDGIRAARLLGSLSRHLHKGGVGRWCWVGRSHTGMNNTGMARLRHAVQPPRPPTAMPAGRTSAIRQPYRSAPPTRCHGLIPLVGVCRSPSPYSRIRCTFNYAIQLLPRRRASRRHTR